ncbi:uncharacterized protein DEA37_0009896 [Paragonimus westermani]|uniref:Uncharacterized protein n=1 Tax=Paragonimus westermani TaxID=34504 RepID=A0A5J4NMZ0_9TREM|nr:uncharacterized protein DEA37_0009896 [Paragonimus westermani]
MSKMRCDAAGPITLLICCLMLCGILFVTAGWFVPNTYSLNSSLPATVNEANIYRYERVESGKAVSTVIGMVCLLFADVGLLIMLVNVVTKCGCTQKHLPDHESNERVPVLPSPKQR